METTQFAMVEELAYLIKDNLYCKHLVLSVEQALVSFLQDDTSSDGILELQPVSPYHRMLLHRLADIFGFAHESVGEGDDRHLILERCADTTIPPILVSDMSCHYGEHEPLSTSDFIIRRNEAPALKTIRQLSHSTPLEEREASYKAARERIFSLHEDDIGNGTVPKSRTVPVVARRMIAHALGRRIGSTQLIEKLSLNESEKEITDELSRDGGKALCSNVEATRGPTVFSTDKVDLNEKKRYSRSSWSIRDPTESNSVGYNKADTGVSSKNNSSADASSRRMLGVEDLKKQQAGAARRIFANALGLFPVKANEHVTLKPNEGNRDSEDTETKCSRS